MARATSKKMKAREFLFYCEDLALAGLPATTPPPKRGVMWTILQLSWGGDPNIHFELQPHVGRGRIELGLHFESDPETNEAWADLLADRAVPIMAALGDGWELEEWTASWRRLHRTFRFERLTAELAREVADAFTLLMTVLQPVVAGAYADGTAPMAPPKPAPSRARHGGRHMRRRARR